MLSPVLWLLISSVQDDLELSTGAYDLLHPTFDAFTDMWDTIDFERFFLNSLIICTASALLATAFASIGRLRARALQVPRLARVRR